MVVDMCEWVKTTDDDRQKENESAAQGGQVRASNFQALWWLL